MTVCAGCGRRLYVSKETSWAGTRRDGTPFVLGRECFKEYRRVWRGE